MKKGMTGILIILLVAFLLFLMAILGYVYRKPLSRLFHGKDKDSDSSQSTDQPTDTTSDASTSIQKYNDPDSSFSFQYPPDWKITENYYYETAAGEKATTPTIVLKNNAGDATIYINMRQKFCMEIPDVSKTRDPLYAESEIYIDFFNYLDVGQTCGQVDLTAPDKNGKDSNYRIVSDFPTASGIKEIFKEFVRSFQKTK